MTRILSYRRLLDVLQGLVKLRGRNTISATLSSDDDKTYIQDCIVNIRKILVESHFIVSIETHKAVMVSILYNVCNMISGTDMSISRMRVSSFS